MLRRAFQTGKPSEINFVNEEKLAPLFFADGYREAAIIHIDNRYLLARFNPAKTTYHLR